MLIYSASNIMSFVQSTLLPFPSYARVCFLWVVTGVVKKLNNIQGVPSTTSVLRYARCGFRGRLLRVVNKPC